MNTYDVRHRTGDLLVHLEDESFSSQLRTVLDEVVPGLPHGEISSDRVRFLREHSTNIPRVFLTDCDFGRIWLELLQPAMYLDKDTLRLLVDLTGALTHPPR